LEGKIEEIKMKIHKLKEIRNEYKNNLEAIEEENEYIKVK
jgi:hypothetical protein